MLLVAFAPALSACFVTLDPKPSAKPIVSIAPSAPGVVAPRSDVERAPVLTLETPEGPEAENARVVLAPVPTRVRECRAGPGQFLRLRLVAGSGKAHYSMDPTTSLDPQLRRCVLEALSTVDIDAISGDASPSARPSGFTAQFRLEW